MWDGARIRSAAIVRRNHIRVLQLLHTHTALYKHRRALSGLFWFVAVKEQSNIATDGIDMFKCVYKEKIYYKNTHKEIVNITLFCYNWIIIYISYNIMEHYIIIVMNNNNYI